MERHSIITFIWIGLAVYHMICSMATTDHDKTQNLVRFYGCLVLAGVWTTA